MTIWLVLLLLLLGGLMAYVRLAPVTVGAWHVDPAAAFAADTPWDTVVAEEGGARLRLSPERGAPADLLARLDAVALATPRTRRLAGSAAEGRITWETRSALWGFPDYTTAEARPDGLYVHAHLRFGRSDLGVNAKRLAAWLAQL